MPTTPEAVFHYEVEKSGDETIGPITTILCHGKLVSETSGQVKEVVKPLIPLGGRIVLDLTDVNYMDSSALGALVGLKVSAIKEGQSCERRAGHGILAGQDVAGAPGFLSGCPPLPDRHQL
jgi:anti-anti-sigma factor